ncbi:MAG: putative molybdenum carrier protein, partial [Nitrosospira sp.]
MKRARQWRHADSRWGRAHRGSLFTLEWTIKIDRPYLHVYPYSEWREWIRAFLEGNPIRILDVSGPRSSSAASTEQFVHEISSA